MYFSVGGSKAQRSDVNRQTTRKQKKNPKLSPEVGFFLAHAVVETRSSQSNTNVSYFLLESEGK